MNIRTTQQIQNNIRDIIQSANSSVALEDGQIVKDIVIDAPSVELRNAYVIASYVRAIQSLDGIEELEDDDTFRTNLATALGVSNTELTEATTWTIPSTITNDIDALIYRDLNFLASNYNLTRTAATRARFIQRFYRADNNSSSPIQVPLSTSVQTLATTPLVFNTITSSSQSLTLNSINGLYYVEETIEASVAGASYNVALNSIRQISPVISQATTTTNTEIASSGADEESNSTLIQRIKDAWAGRELASITGLQNFVTSFSGISNSYVADPSDDLFTRASAGGADIFILGRNLTQYSESHTYRSGTNRYLLQLQPVTSITSVIGSVSGTVTGFTLYESGGDYDKSARALNYLNLSSVSGLFDGETLTVLSYYDKNVYDVQAALGADANRVIASDFLAKYSDIVYIDHILEVTTFSGQDPSDDINEILSSFYNGGTVDGTTYSAKNLGENIEKSDVINLITELSDIDSLDTDTLSIVRRTGDDGSDPIVIEGNEYARLGRIVLTWS